ncbi:MFS transporter [Microbacterium sp. NPDC058345]|uniref:MFS transporter n=1 Tax=Microbacterium sp. NPDC058345 TaxID=3346455 RepID=UPI003649D901
MSRPQLPRGFNAWVATSVGSELGSGVLAFALTWVASGHGSQVASWVLTLTVAPSVALGLLGGAVADRFGARRVMIFGTLALMIVSGLLAAAVALWGTPPFLLMVTATLIGIVAAFHRPAVGVFPRLFVADSSVLGAAMARAGMAGQLARTIAPPLGGLLIGVVTVSGVALVDVLGCVAMLVALLLIHPPLTQVPAAEAVTLRGVVTGVTTARVTRGVPALLLCVAIVAGAVIPAVLLGIPLAARERGWTAAEAGLTEAGWIAGGLLSGAWFAWRGTATKAWRPMAAGPLIVAAGLGLLAGSPSWPVAAASTTLIGVGVVIFTAHVFPIYILLAPPTMLSRFQSLLILVQQAPQLIVNPLIGLTVAAVGAGPMIAASGGIALLASLVVATDKTLRTSTAGD